MRFRPLLLCLHFEHFLSQFSKYCLNSKMKTIFFSFNSKLFFQHVTVFFLFTDGDFLPFSTKKSHLVKFDIKNKFSDSLPFQKCIRTLSLMTHHRAIFFFFTISSWLSRVRMTEEINITVKFSLENLKGVSSKVWLFSNWKSKQ